MVGMGLCIQPQSGVAHPTRVVGGTKVLGYILGLHVAKFVAGDALGVQRAHEASVYHIKLRGIVLPQDEESMCNRKGTSSLRDPACVVGVVGQMVLYIGDVLAEAILAKASWVVDVKGADDAGRGRGPGAVHGHDERVHVCVGELACTLAPSIGHYPPPLPPHAHFFKTRMT